MEKVCIEGGRKYREKAREGASCSLGWLNITMRHEAYTDNVKITSYTGTLAYQPQISSSMKEGLHTQSS